MSTSQLLGKVAAQYLKERLSDEDAVGTARYLLDCLTAEQTAAVGKAVLEDPSLDSLVEIKFPRHFVSEYGLPDSVLTGERTTYFRNAACDKSALLVANTGDDEQQSLKELVPIGAAQLLNHPELWVKAASADLALVDDHLKWWQQALRGLGEARSIPLERFAQYVSDTREAITEHGQPMRCALGFALPALHLPRDTNYFNSLNDKTSGHASKWKKLYADAFKKRGCYLLKQTPTQSLLDEETLSQAFEKVKDTIPANCHPTVEAFISASSGWNAQATDLALCEWESVKPIFDGLKREAFNLGKATIDFYGEGDPEVLSDNDRDYLDRLVARKTTEPDDEDCPNYQLMGLRAG